MKYLLVALCILSLASCGFQLPGGPKPSRYAVVAFTASWCEACRRDSKRVNALRDAGVEVVEINPQRYPDAAKRRGVKSIPFYTVFDGITIVLETDDISMVLQMVGVTE